ncbi:hypothetical protein TIFTF001_008192 [Ficus carica]|uniref:Uncharacterized protein n=1 Tax=Ficus carica TaxID=3494 RepID=A0AA87ZRR7_FICCA|nr:hypothetical protein TIFTF001_008192 [Ficus carica]
MTVGSSRRGSQGVGALGSRTPFPSFRSIRPQSRPRNLRQPIGLRSQLVARQFEKSFKAISVSIHGYQLAIFTPSVGFMATHGGGRFGGPGDSACSRRHSIRRSSKPPSTRSRAHRIDQIDQQGGLNLCPQPRNRRPTTGQRQSSRHRCL